MAENGFFKTVFRGFRKEDVLNYIESLHTEHCEELSGLQEDVATLTGQKQALENEMVSLRALAEQTETAKADLAQAEQRLQEMQAQTANLQQKLADTENRLQACAQVQNENAVLKEQLEAQKAQLERFEKMFGDSSDAVAFVRQGVCARMEESRRRTERVVSDAEQLTMQLSAELEKLRARTAAIRNEAVAAGEQDAQALNEWFSQFDKRVSADTEKHFFR